MFFSSDELNKMKNEKNNKQPERPTKTLNITFLSLFRCFDEHTDESLFE